MSTLIDPAKRTTQPSHIQELTGGLRAYLNNGAMIKLGEFGQPSGNDNSRSGWTVTGHKFVLHGIGLLIGRLAPGEKIEWVD